MISKYELKSILNRQFRINEVLKDEALSAATTIELANLAIKLADEVKEVQDSGGVAI